MVVILELKYRHAYWPLGSKYLNRIHLPKTVLTIPDTETLTTPYLSTSRPSGLRVEPEYPRAGGYHADAPRRKRNARSRTIFKATSSSYPKVEVGGMGVAKQRGPITDLLYRI